MYSARQKRSKFEAVVEKIVLNNYYGSDMVQIYQTIKAEGDKITLSGLFVAALLIAHFITAARAVVILSEPITLNYTGLSVPIPTGPDWQSTKKWEYYENGFTLNGVFNAGSASPKVLVSCRYLFSAKKSNADTQLEQRASAVAGQIMKTGQTQTEDAITIDWARIEKPKIPAYMLFGTAQLPNNRQLELEVQQVASGDNLAEELFSRISKGLHFQDNQFLNAGSEIVAQIKSEGVSSFLRDCFEKRLQNGLIPDDQMQQVFLLIKDTKSQPIGFTMDLLADYDQQENFNIRATSLFYLRGQQEQFTSFQSDNSFNEFAWRSETSGLTGRSSTEVILDNTGGLTVKKLGPLPQEKIYQLGPAAIPDVLLELVFRQMLASGHKEIIVDVIDAEGKISPVLVSKVEAEQANSAEGKTGYLLRMELLGRDSLEWIYLDEHARISKRLLARPNPANSALDSQKQQDAYILERTSPENILRQFPERAEYISQKNGALNQPVI